MKVSYGFVKWITGGLGWTLGGPVFGVLGFFAGTVVDSLAMERKTTDAKSSIGVFSTNLLMIISAVLRAGYPISKAKEDFVKQFLRKNFGEEGAKIAFAEVKLLIRKSIPLEEACAIIRNNLDVSTRIQFVNFLSNLANIGDKSSTSERSVLNRIEEGMKVNFNNMQTFVRKDTVMAAYNVLGVGCESSVAEIKKAYRNLAVKCHPDKTAHLDGDTNKTAKENFQRLTQAYVLLKKEKNFT